MEFFYEKEAVPRETLLNGMKLSCQSQWGGFGVGNIVLKNKVILGKLI